MSKALDSHARAAVEFVGASLIESAIAQLLNACGLQIATNSPLYIALLFVINSLVVHISFICSSHRRK